jgi:ribose transport system permease protein
MKALIANLRSPSPILLAYAGTLLLFLLISLYSPGFASPSHVSTLIVVASFTGIVAIGQTMVIVGGGIDLSVPWMLNCAAVATTAITKSHDSTLLWAVPLILVSSAVVGAVNGAGIALLRVPPIVMTLAMNVVLLGLLFITTRGFPPPPTPKALQFIAGGRIGPFPVMLFVWAALTVVVLVVERLTAFGRYLYAIGSNRTVAVLSGVPVVRTTITAYAVSGVTAALAGILLTGYAKQSYLGMGNPYLFTSIAAVAIGGASILGGSGSYLGTIAGALLLTILTGILPIFRLDAGALQVIYGAVILITVSLAAPPVQALLSRRRNPRDS